MLNVNDVELQAPEEEELQTPDGEELQAAEQEEEKSSTGDIIVRVIAAVLCTVFGFITLLNIILIIKSIINPDEPATIFGHAPVVVNTEAMEGDRKDSLSPGDLAILRKTDFDDLKKGDVVTYLHGDMILVGRISGENKYGYTVKGDQLKYVYGPALTEENFFATVRVSFPFFGDLALFMMTPAGLIIFIAIPTFAVVAIAIIEVLEYLQEKKQLENEEGSEEENEDNAEENNESA